MGIDALKDDSIISTLCEELEIPQCSYYYARKASDRPDKHLEARRRILAIFDSAPSVSGMPLGTVMTTKDR